MKRGRDFFQVPGDDRDGLPLRRADEALVAAIIEEAKRRGIELTTDQELLATLASVESEAQIPGELYAAIAVVLSWMDGLGATASSGEGGQASS